MTICIFGATGLIGSHLLQYSLQSEKVKQVKIFVRKNIDIVHPKLMQIVCSLDTVEQSQIANLITGDVLFNCLGTTLKIAGSKEAQFAVDCTYPIKVARIALGNGMCKMINVSSVGANLNGNFYLQTKARMEQGVSQYFNNSAFFVRPSFLTGKRNEFRIGEKIGIIAFYFINLLLWGGLSKYRSIPAQKVAAAMLQIGFSNDAPNVLHYSEIKTYAKHIV